jgi:hypothetical protein
LARAVNVIHPDILENLLSSKQIAELEIFNSLEPAGEQAEWLRMAILACMYRNSKTPKGKKLAGIKDFMPEYYYEPKQEQSMLDMMKTLNSAMKKQEKKRKKING